jgi:hypothetical protein
MRTRNLLLKHANVSNTRESRSKKTIIGNLNPITVFMLLKDAITCKGAQCWGQFQASS